MDLSRRVYNHGELSNLLTFQFFNLLTFQPSNFLTFQPFNFLTFQPFNLSTFSLYNLPVAISMLLPARPGAAIAGDHFIGLGWTP